MNRWIAIFAAIFVVGFFGTVIFGVWGFLAALFGVVVGLTLFAQG